MDNIGDKLRISVKNSVESSILFIYYVIGLWTFTEFNFDTEHHFTHFQFFLTGEKREGRWIPV